MSTRVSSGPRLEYQATKETPLCPPVAEGNKRKDDEDDEEEEEEDERLKNEASAEERVKDSCAGQGRTHLA